jgi:hypothetical protein
MLVQGALTLLVNHIDDRITLCPKNQPIMDIIRSMKTDYTLADEGDMLAYLDIQVDCKETSAGLEFHLTQPALII